MNEPKPSSLQDDIKQTVPFRSPGQEAVIALTRTADMVERWFDKALEPYGVTGPQYNVLRILRGARGKPLPTLEVGDRMIQRTPGITRMIDRLEAKGLVVRQPCQHDRRIVYCLITPKGLELLAQTDELVNGLEDEVGSALGTDQVPVVLAGLSRIRAMAEE